MKNKLALALALIIPASFAYAEDSATQTPDVNKPAHHQKMDRAGFKNKMDKELALTDEQKSSIKQIMVQSREETNTKIMNVLTPEQQIKFKEMKDKRPHVEHHVKKVQEAENK